MAAMFRRRYPFRQPQAEVDHLIIGGGVVGCAIAHRFATRLKGKSTFLVERHNQLGQETSSRNSEVIHGGFYYPPDSLKTALCLRGRPLLYQFCEAHGVEHRKCGKLVVATSSAQATQLRRLYQSSISLNQPIPLQLLSGDEARGLEPDIHPLASLALYSPETGILDTHELMNILEEQTLQQDAGGFIYGTQVVRIDRAEGEQGWVVQTAGRDGGEPTGVLARVVVNAAGLSAHHILNQILPQNTRQPVWLCKGSYFRYTGQGASVTRLVYPAPAPDLAGLGTHLTIDLAGNVRFGPDVQWLDAPRSAPEDPDWWSRHLAAPDDESRLDRVYEAVASYLPNVSRDGFSPDYAGIRPKLRGPGASPSDFSITHPAPGFINLMGIESPGLTACLAIAEYVERVAREQYWGIGRGSGYRASAVGPGPDAWL